MSLRPSIRVLLLWLTTLVLLAGLLGAVYIVHRGVRGEQERQAQADKVERERPRGRVVKLGAARARWHEILDEPARACTWQERVAVYGRVVTNPLATAELRSPFSGKLRAAADHPCLAPGTHVHAGQTLAWIDVRVGPQERLDLQAKLIDARNRQQAAERVYQIQQTRLERYGGADEVTRIIQARRTDPARGVSLRELEEALVEFTKAQSELASARSNVELWQVALDEIDRRGSAGFPVQALPLLTLPAVPPAAGGLAACAAAVPVRAWSRPLKAPLDGEIAELVGTPGMAVEAGGLVARLVDFRRPLVLLDLPPEVVAAGPEPEVDLFPVVTGPLALRGAFNRPESASPPPSVRATRLGPAPQVDAGSQFAGYLYQVQPDLSKQPTGANCVPWRPALAVKGFLAAPDGRQLKAVSVPETALLYHQGRALVYVRIAPGKYERREVTVLGRQGDRWVVGSNVAPAEPVVSRNAQLLLAEEFLVEADND